MLRLTAQCKSTIYCGGKVGSVRRGLDSVVSILTAPYSAKRKTGRLPSFPMHFLIKNGVRGIKYIHVHWSQFSPKQRPRLCFNFDDAHGIVLVRFSCLVMPISELCSSSSLGHASSRMVSVFSTAHSSVKWSFTDTVNLRLQAPSLSTSTKPVSHFSAVTYPLAIGVFQVVQKSMTWASP